MKHFRITLRWSLAALLLISILAAVWVGYPRAEYKSSTVKTATAQAPVAALPLVAQSNTNHAEVNPPDTPPIAEPAVVDVFAVRTWEPPKPVVPIAKPAPPPPPQAPPLPFRFLGKIADPEKGTAFLLIHGEQILSVGIGDKVDGIYLIDKLEAGQLYFLYQPLNIRQSLAVGSDL